MKQKLLNSLRLRVCALVALLLCATGSAWATDVTYDFTSTNNFYTTSDGDTHPSTGSSNVLSSFYGSDRAAFTATGDVYFNSGYLMAKKGCTITLPTFSGKKITSIAITNSSGCSTSTSVAIKSGSSTASSAQTWSTQSKTYNYSIGESYQSSALKISVSSANAQITKIKITTEAITHTITYSASNGTISGVDAKSAAVASGASVAEGATVTLTATPASGYEFSSWEFSGTGSSLSNTSTNPTTFTMGTANATVTANFVAADTRAEAGLSYTNSSESAVILAGTTHKQSLNNPNSLGSITYTSSDETVATVASDGTVTLVKAGEVTITASFAGNASYKPGNASYTLTITDKYVAELVFNDDALEKLTTDAAFTNDWDTDPSGLGVIFSSSNTDVATVGMTSGKVTIVGAGETTITAQINDVSYEQTQFNYTLTVSKADAPISFSSASATTAMDETESFVAPTLSNEQSLTITWTSSDATVASINSSTGVISFLKAGSTTITATSTENATYKSGAVSYTLTVTKAAENMPFAAALNSLSDFTITPDATLGNLWTTDGYAGAKASAYKNSKQNAGESWLISPYINITSAYTTLSFEHADRYFNSESEMKTEATLWIREKGGDWEQLTIATYPEYTGTDKSSYASTSNSLSSYLGKKVQIGFKYLGNTTSAGSWWVKNFRVADDREEAPISFANATVYELLKNAGTYTGQALTNEESLTVSYTSSNTDVATVNSSTGVVTIKAVGETNITATYAETASYKANTATYKLVVTSKAAAEIEYADDAATKKITLGTYTHTLTNPNDLTVAYTSSDETVATVNSSTGEVTMLKVGETTITATFTEDEDYDGATASYTLTVIKDDPTLTFAKATVTAGLADGTYTQAVTTTPAELSVTYTSSDETVATVASDGTATLLKTGSTTITANFAGNASYNSASTTYTLNVAVNYATLPFSYNKGYSDIGTTLTGGTTGLMQSGLNTTDYGTTNTKLKFDGTGDNVILKIAEIPGTLSFSIKGNSFSKGTFKVQTSIDGESYTDLASYTSLGDESTESFNLAGNVRYVKWIYTNKSTGNVGLGNINLTKTNTITLAEACTDGSKYYGTYSLGKAFVVPAGLTVSTVGLDNEGKLEVTEYSTGDVVKANTGVLVSATSAGAKTVTVSAETGTENDGNLLKASGDAGITAVNMAVDDTKFYRLTMHNGTDLGFWWGAAEGAAFALAANKAYLAVPDDAVPEVKSFMWFEDTPTAVSEMKNDGVKSERSIYNLAGQRMSKLQKGVNIVNGHKVLVK